MKPDHIVEYHEEIAREASKTYNQKYPKPPVQPRSVVRKPSVQRNLISTPLLENLNVHNGHILNNVDDIRQHHYNTTLANHLLAQDDECPPPSYVSYNHRIVQKCRYRRQLRRGFKNRDTFIRIRQLPLQVTNNQYNQSINQFFNGLPF